MHSGSLSSLTVLISLLVSLLRDVRVLPLKYRKGLGSKGSPGFNSELSSAALMRLELTKGLRLLIS